jgi:hypothetical protein
MSTSTRKATDLYNTLKHNGLSALCLWTFAVLTFLWLLLHSSPDIFKLSYNVICVCLCIFVLFSFCAPCIVTLVFLL